MWPGGDWRSRCRHLSEGQRAAQTYGLLVRHLYWKLYYSSRHLRLLPQHKVTYCSHTHTPSLNTLSINDSDSHLLLTQVEGQAHSKDSGTLHCARDRRRHQRDENRLSSEVRCGGLCLQDHQWVRNQASGVQGGGQRWSTKLWICLLWIMLQKVSCKISLTLSFVCF